MKKIIFFVIFICYLLVGIKQTPDCFAQGGEWQRIRTSIGGEGPDATGEQIPIPAYYIGVGDQIEIFVWQNSDLTRHSVVGPDGKISYPLLGRIKVVGLTLDRLEEKVRRGLSNYIKYPEVTVAITQFTGSKVVVLGEVIYPGIYTYKGSLTVFDALALAGDFTEMAREDSVIIVRDSLSGDSKIIRLNLKSALEGRISGQNIALQPNDVVYVPKSYIANFNKFMNNLQPVISRITSILGLKPDLHTIDRGW